MKSWCRTLVIVIGLVQGSSVYAQGVLAPSGVPAGPPEAVLPAGAVAHLRLNNLGETLVSLDQLLMTFLPEKAVPDEYRSHLQEKHPVLSFVGAQLAGEPLSNELLGRLFGVDLSRPATLSVYPTQFPMEGVVVSIPVSDFIPVTALLINGLESQKIEQVKVDDKVIYRLDSASFGTLFIACSPKTAYICGSQELATLLLVDGPRLGRSAMMQSAITENAEHDFNLVIDASSHKAFLLQLAEQYKTPPAESVEFFVYSFLSSIFGEDYARGGLTTKILTWSGVPDPENLQDYIVVGLISAYDVLFQFLTEQAQGFDGLVFSMDVQDTYHKTTFSVFSSAISPDQFAQPIRVADLKEVLQYLPGERSSVSMTGQISAPVQSQLVTQWLTTTQARLKARQLDDWFIRTLLEYHTQAKPAVPLAARVPWTVTTYVTPPVPAPKTKPRSVVQWAQQQLTLQNYAAPQQLTVVPKQDGEFIKKHFASNANTLKASDNLYTDFLRKNRINSDWQQRDFRSFHQSNENGLQRIVREDSFTVRTPFFGYTEHELVSRNIIHYRDIGKYTYLHQGHEALPWLQQTKSPETRAVPPSIERLLTYFPENANQVTIERTQSFIPGLIEWLSEFETVAHAEVQDYVNALNKIHRSPNLQREEKQQQVLSYPQPPLVQSLNWDPTQKRLYCVLVGNLHYPRPRVGPVLVDLTSEYVQRSEELGGAFLATSIQPGRYRAVNVISTEGIAFLVKSSVNRFFDKFVLPEDGVQKLQQAIAAPNDGDARSKETVQLNPIWASLGLSSRAPRLNSARPLIRPRQ